MSFLKLTLIGFMACWLECQRHCICSMLWQFIAIVTAWQLPCCICQQMFVDVCELQVLSLLIVCSCSMLQPVKAWGLLLKSVATTLLCFAFFSHITCSKYFWHKSTNAGGILEVCHWAWLHGSSHCDVVKLHCTSGEKLAVVTEPGGGINPGTFISADSFLLYSTNIWTFYEIVYTNYITSHSLSFEGG